MATSAVKHMWTLGSVPGTTKKKKGNKSNIYLTYNQRKLGDTQFKLISP